MIFFKKPRSPAPPPTLKIKLNGVRFVPTKTVKYLGIHLDENLSGSVHCNKLIPKLSRANAILSKLRHFLPFRELKSVYHSIFSSHMLFNCQAWGTNNNNNFRKIETLQNNALRIITFSEFRCSASPLYKDLKILKLKDHISLLNCLFVHDQLNNNVPKNFSVFFLSTSNLYARTTRNSSKGKIYVPTFKSNKYGSKSLKHLCISSWNDAIDYFKNTDFNKVNKRDLKMLLTQKFLNSY